MLKLKMFRQLTLFQCAARSSKRPRSEPTPLVNTECVQEAEEHSQHYDHRSVDSSESEHSCSDSAEEEDDFCDSPIEASMTVTMASASSSPCRESNIMPLSTSHSSSQCDVVDIAQTPASPPVQPVMSNYPATIFSGKARSFSQAWYSAYPWLEYSIQANACFCYSCRLFGNYNFGPGFKCE